MRFKNSAFDEQVNKEVEENVTKTIPLFLIYLLYSVVGYSYVYLLFFYRFLVQGIKGTLPRNYSNIRYYLLMDIVSISVFPEKNLQIFEYSRDFQCMVPLFIPYRAMNGF